MGQAKNIIREIKQGKIFPVYLLHGEEAYLIEDTVAEMIELLVPKSVRDFNLDIFSGPDASIEEILSAADTYPVMAERRVVVVKNPGFLGSKKEIEPLDLFRESKEFHRIGDFSRSAMLLARAINLDPEEFAEGGTAFKKAIGIFKSNNEDELSTDDLEFLEDAAIDLAKEIDVSSASLPSGGVDRLIEWLRGNPAPNTVLIFATSSTLNSNDRAVKAISQVGMVVGFGRLKQSSYVNRDPMYQMVIGRLKEHGKSIAPDAFSELQKKTGNNMGQIFDELDKLVTFVGDRPRIEKNDVEELVARSDFGKIFDLTNAVGQKSLPLALSTLKNLLDKGDHPILIHTMLTRQIRFLLQAKLMLEAGMIKQDVQRMNYDSFQQGLYKKLLSELGDKLPESKQLNILKQPYPLYVTLQQAKNFTVEELIKAMERLLSADIQLKTGRLTPQLVVEMLVMDLCSPSVSRPFSISADQ